MLFVIEIQSQRYKTIRSLEKIGGKRTSKSANMTIAVIALMLKNILFHGTFIELIEFLCHYFV